MQPQPEQGIPVMEVKKRLLEELEAMGFPRTRAAKALHHSENSTLETAINWIIDHENDSANDQRPEPEPEIAMDIEIQSPEPSDITEIMRVKAQELRNHARKNREEEEKKREREREKERIRAGKELLQTKRIAEENERKRFIAAQKAEKEEEKRARERILHKLETDKLERRRRLGLSPVKSPAAVNASTLDTSASVVPGNEVYHISVKTRFKPVAKNELLEECLRSLRRNYKDDDTRVKRAFHTLLIYVGNVVKNPHMEKYRRIRLTNPFFQERIGNLEGGVKFLELCGFERSERSELLVLPHGKIDMAILNSAVSTLTSAISNPYFGLLSRPSEDAAV